MWCEIINNGGLLAILGVVVGFLLSEVSSIVKKHIERKDAKNTLLDEVRFNHKQTEHKIDILNQAIFALRSKKFLSTKCAKYSTTEFEKLYHIAIQKLSNLERDNLRHLNSLYLAIDNLLNGFDESFKNDLDNIEVRENTLDSIYESEIIQLDNIRESLKISLTLSSGYLKGKPLPIFNEEQT